MTLSQDLQRLSQEIATAHEDRKLFKQKIKNDVLNIKKSTSDLRRDSLDLMETIKDKRHEMSQRLRAGLTQFKTDIETAGKDRRKEAKNAHKQRIEENNQRRADMIRFKQETHFFLKKVNKTQKTIGDDLRMSLEDFVSGLKVSEKERKSSINDFLTSLKTEHRDMALAWQGVSSSKPTVVSDTEITALTEIIADRDSKEDALGDDDKPQPFESSNEIHDHLLISTSSEKPDPELEPEPEAELEEKAPMYKEDEVIEEDKSVEENDVVEVTDNTDNSDHSDADMEQLKNQVANALKDYSDGLKMTQVAELLNIDQWRTLIPVMRELQEMGIIRKEGYLYCYA